jgi:hypothetical protein
MPLILTNQEVEIRRSEVCSQPRQTVRPYLKKKSITKKCGVTQGVSPELKPPVPQKKSGTRRIPVQGQHRRKIRRYGGSYL